MNQIITVQFSKDTGTSYIQIYFYDLQHLKCVEDGHLHFKFAFFFCYCALAYVSTLQGNLMVDVLTSQEIL